LKAARARYDRDYPQQRQAIAEANVSSEINRALRA